TGIKTTSSFRINGPMVACIGASALCPRRDCGRPRINVEALTPQTLEGELPRFYAGRRAGLGCNQRGSQPAHDPEPPTLLGFPRQGVSLQGGIDSPG